jgi:hypothetical protein
MATQHRHTDAVATTGAKASVETVTEDRVQGDQGDVISGMRAESNLAQRQLESERTSHQAEVKRLNDIITSLQTPMRGSAARLADPQTPQDALHYIITFFERVAVGGAGNEMRLAVHKAALHLDAEHRKELREYISRLRYAAEAADQEATTLAL